MEYQKGFAGGNSKIGGDKVDDNGEDAATLAKSDSAATRPAHSAAPVTPQEVAPASLRGGKEEPELADAELP